MLLKYYLAGTRMLLDHYLGAIQVLLMGSFCHIDFRMEMLVNATKKWDEG